MSDRNLFFELGFLFKGRSGHRIIDPHSMSRKIIEYACLESSEPSQLPKTLLCLLKSEVKE